LLLFGTSGLHFDFSFFWSSLVHPSHVWLDGLLTTVLVAVVSQLLATILGLLLALARRSRIPPLRGFVRFYVWIFRGTPLLVQLVMVYDGLAAVGIYTFNTHSIGPIVVPAAVQAAIVTFTMNEAAYMSEIIRASLNAVDSGQLEAALSTGMTPGQAMRLVVVPQAVRYVVPPLGNDFNAMMKNTALAYVISMSTLFLVTTEINSTTFHTFEIFTVCAIYYLALTTVWGFAQSAIERRIDRRWGIVRPPRSWRSWASTWGRRRPMVVGPPSGALPDEEAILEQDILEGVVRTHGR
jgi:polar amino acid transport system permease protein